MNCYFNTFGDENLSEDLCDENVDSPTVNSSLKIFRNMSNHSFNKERRWISNPLTVPCYMNSDDSSDMISWYSNGKEGNFTHWDKATENYTVSFEPEMNYQTNSKDGSHSKTLKGDIKREKQLK